MTTERDWDFAFGDLGDPLADIDDWMIPPYPQCIIDGGIYESTSPRTHKLPNKEKRT